MELELLGSQADRRRYWCWAGAGMELELVALELLDSQADRHRYWCWARAGMELELVVLERLSFHAAEATSSRAAQATKGTKGKTILRDWSFFLRRESSWSYEVQSTIRATKLTVMLW